MPAAGFVGALRSPRLRAAAVTALGAAFLAAFLPGAAAQEEVAWSQFQGDAAHTGAPAAGPAPPYRAAWSFRADPAGEGGLSPPVLAGGVAVAVAVEAVVAVDPATGAEAWRLPRAAGPVAPPAVAPIDGAPAVLFTEGREPDAALRAVALADRSDVWDAPFALEGTSRSGVAVDGERAYVVDGGTLRAVDLATGREAWRVEVPGTAAAPPAVAGGTVFVVARDDRLGLALVRAFDAGTGERAWSFSPASRAGLASAPTVAGSRVVVGFADRTVRAFDAGSGRLVWGARTNGLLSPVTAAAVVGDDVVVADLAGQVYRLDGADGSREWDHALNDHVIRSAPVVVGGSVVLGLNDGRLVALDAATGDLRWQSEPSPGLVGALAVAADVIVAVKGGRGGGLVGFRHDPEGTLVRVPSPTRLDLDRQLATALGAVLVVGVAILLAGRWAAARLGPPAAEGPGGPAEDER
jgi:outer membrane protein assembly factor BamB